MGWEEASEDYGNDGISDWPPCYFINVYNYSTLAFSKSIPLSFASFSRYDSDDWSFDGA
jgi:hypothetical protein